MGVSYHDRKYAVNTKPFLNIGESCEIRHTDTPISRGRIDWPSSAVLPYRHDKPIHYARNGGGLVR